jgi:hypothetical protein
LALQIRNLRAQLLDAKMLVEERRGLLGELRPQGDALLGQSAQQLGIDDIGEFERRAGLQRIANELCLGFRISHLRPRRGKLGVEIAQLLIGKRGVVVADEEICLGAILLDLSFRLTDISTQTRSFAG